MEKNKELVSTLIEKRYSQYSLSYFQALILSNKIGSPQQFRSQLKKESRIFKLKKDRKSVV